MTDVPREMSSSARRYVVGSWRTLCSAFTLDPTAEKFAFARFNNDEGDGFPPSSDDGDGHQQRRRRTLHLGGSDTELADLPNRSMGVGGGVDGGHPVKIGETEDNAKDVNASDSHWMMTEGGGEHGGNNQNRISAWQAGWNVTNAIQVNYSPR